MLVVVPVEVVVVGASVVEGGNELVGDVGGFVVEDEVVGPLVEVGGAVEVVGEVVEGDGLDVEDGGAPVVVGGVGQVVGSQWRTVPGSSPVTVIHGFAATSD